MGAFFLLLGENHESNKISIAENVFKDKGLKLNKKITKPGFTVLVYKKKYLNNENFLEIGNEDFVISTGTMIYKGKKGRGALECLYNDFSGSNEYEKDLRGNFSFILFKKGELFFSQDGLGYYPVYCNDEMSLISSSFLAVSKCTEGKKISVQELYEYILNGQFVSDRTFIKGIKLTDHKVKWRLIPEKSALKRISLGDIIPSKSLVNHLESSQEILTEIFSSITDAFGSSLTSALSGGYDTRLVLAVLRNLGVTPRLYVYGNELSKDVRIAKMISQGENLILDHIDKAQMTERKSPEEYRDLLKEHFYLFDGCGGLGAFDDGTDMATRKRRICDGDKELLHINGAGGEIFREIWYVWNKNIKLDDFIKIRFDLNDFSFCGRHFNTNEYFLNLKNKLKDIYKIDRDWISRQELELMFPLLRNRLAAINCSINNQFSYSILPYMERDLVLQSYSIPVKYKEHGFFQNELMKHFDPELSKYNSQYGINFYNKISMKKKLTDSFFKIIPIAFRPFLKDKKRKLTLPYYMEEKYIKEVFGSEEFILKDYLNLERIKDKNMLSRAMTVEIFLRDIF